MVFDKMAAIYTDFKCLGLPDIRSHSKSGPFETQPLFEHSKSRLVRISDPHCKYKKMSQEKLKNNLK